MEQQVFASLFLFVWTASARRPAHLIRRHGSLPNLAMAPITKCWIPIHPSNTGSPVCLRPRGSEQCRRIRKPRCRVLRLDRRTCRDQPDTSGATESIGASSEPSPVGAQAVVCDEIRHISRSTEHLGALRDLTGPQKEGLQGGYGVQRDVPPSGRCVPSTARQASDDLETSGTDHSVPGRPAWKSLGV